MMIEQLHGPVAPHGKPLVFKHERPAQQPGELDEVQV
jgi:hypothetical protein